MCSGPCLGPREALRGRISRPVAGAGQSLHFALIPSKAPGVLRAHSARGRRRRGAFWNFSGASHVVPLDFERAVGSGRPTQARGGLGSDGNQSSCPWRVVLRGTGPRGWLGGAVDGLGEKLLHGPGSQSWTCLVCPGVLAEPPPLRTGLWGSGTFCQILLTVLPAWPGAWGEGPVPHLCPAERKAHSCRAPAQAFPFQPEGTQDMLLQMSPPEDGRAPPHLHANLPGTALLQGPSAAPTVGNPHG